MKKLFVTMLSILACGAAYALPVGNPSEASLLCDGLFWEGFCGDPCDPCMSWSDAWSVRVGFYGDYVYNRHLRVNDSPNRDVIEHSRLNTNAGIITLNFWDRFDVFATLGASDFSLDTNAVSFQVTPVVLNRRVEIETQTSFSWSVGGRATLWECGCTTLGIEGQYFSFRPRVERVSIGADNSVYPDHITKLHYHEWQVGLGLSHRINMLVPYVAVDYSRAHSRFTNPVLVLAPVAQTVDLFNLKSNKHWGYAVGVSLVDCEKAFVTVEGRWGSEKGIYVTGQVRF